MPNVQVSSNVSSAGVDKVKVMAAISKALATALDKSEQVVMVHLNLDMPMLFQASDACYHHAVRHVTSNVPKSNVDVPTALRALSKALSEALGKPEAYVMVQLDLDTPMIFQASDAPCAFIQIRSIGRIGPDLNPKTAASLTTMAAEALKIPADRIFLNLDDVDAANWAMAGNTIG
ncbi:Drug/Metabolite Transporter (DMT) Superfamily [Phytophthora nicotianae]|uniref:L-dopachrome isomerase n=1 Tax=Phytophthora nicotianae TaxID=4792 RepID=A0A0W8DGZ4_PHYNI|nr:Drug/Metabolite Transporter (DMT) Superfamily [Phytophthora nicotianae]